MESPSRQGMEGPSPQDLLVAAQPAGEQGALMVLDPPRPSGVPRKTIPVTHTMIPISTDNGSDVVASRMRIKSATARLLRKLVFDMGCQLHQYHIVVRESLHVMDDLMRDPRVREKENDARTTLRYYGTVAKAMHIWRESAMGDLQSV